MGRMLLSRRTRAAVNGIIYCHDDCDPNMAPRRIKSLRRRNKRAENQRWKRNTETI